MLKRMLTVAGALALALSGTVAASAATAATDDVSTAHGSHSGFVTRVGSQLFLDGRPFRFAGSNNYYPMYSSRVMVDAVLAKAVASDFDVFRAWGSFEIGDPADPTTNVDPGAKDKNVYFQYWDAAAGPAYNDGANGLQMLDYVVAKAAALDLKLVFPLVNNWRDFGGMDQYVKWRGGSFHDDFYTDAVIKGWYKDWISHLLNHVNSLTGVAYKNDPAIMMWELGNEPRCGGSGVFPTSPACTTTAVTGWADEMTRYIRSVDRRHLRSVGDEGWYCLSPTNTDFAYNCSQGIDDVALTKLSAVDVMSLHAYPDYWGKDLAWVHQWILDHVRDARRLNKAVMWGEFGWTNKATRNVVYKDWTDTFRTAGGNGALYWLLSDLRDDGTLYPDYDGFTVYCPSPVCTTITNFSHAMAGRVFPAPNPVADHDSATTEFNTPVTLSPLANDIAYVGSPKPNTVDLDPATAGRQTTVTVAGGTFTLDPAAVLTFTPAVDFAGAAGMRYTVADVRNKLSNVATVTVTVKPDPNAAVVLFTYEDGLQGWGTSFDPAAGSVEQTTAFHSQGAAGLHLTVNAGGGFFGLNPATPLNLSGKLFLKYEMTGSATFGTQLAVQAGPDWTWCQAAGTQFQAGSTMTVEYNLADLNCAPGLSEIHGIHLWFNPGAFDIDTVRVE